MFSWLRCRSAVNQVVMCRAPRVGIAFPEINLNQHEDVEELNTLCHAYAEMVGLDFSIWLPSTFSSASPLPVLIVGDW